MVLDGERLARIEPQAVRIGRDLHLVDRLVKENTSVLEELSSHIL